MKKYKALDILLLCMKIILPILILVPLVFLSFRLVESHLEDLANIGNDGYHSGIGLYIFASHTLLFAANAVLTVVGGIGWGIAKRYKTCPFQKKNIITFRCLTLAPLCSQMLYLVINVIVMNIG